MSEREWQPIETAPDLERVMVCGWKRPSGTTSGYWWYHEDVCDCGEALERPAATHWTPVNLPAFPPPPTEKEQ